MRRSEEIAKFGYHLLEDRRKDIFEEQEHIKNKYKLNTNIIELIFKFYYTNSNISLGNVSKTIDFIAYVLKCYQYTDEEITKFITLNKRMILSSYSDFRLRLAIFSKCNLFEDVFFKYSSLINYDGVILGLSTRELYAFAKKNNFDITLEDYNKALNLSQIKKENIIKKYPLTKEEINKIDSDLLNMLKEIKKLNTQKHTL